MASALYSERVNALIAAEVKAEREACAKIIDDNAEGYITGTGERVLTPRGKGDVSGLGYAAAIRNRK